jgi:hypothetical protein
MCCDHDNADIDIVLSSQVGFEVRYCSPGDKSVAPVNFCGHLDLPPGCDPPEEVKPDYRTFYQPFYAQTDCRECPEGLQCVATCPPNRTNCTAQEVVRYAYSAGPDYWVMNHESALQINPLGLGPLKCAASGACIGNNKCVWTDEMRHEGLLCSKCAAGYTRRKLTDPCRPCPPLIESILWTVLAQSLLAAWIALQIYACRRGGTDPKSVESIILKLFVNYCQMTATSFAISHIGMRSYLGWYINACDFLSQDPLRVMMKMDCLFDLRGGDKVLEYKYIFIMLIIIPCAVVAAVVLFTLVRLCSMVVNKCRKQYVGRIRRSEYGPVVLVTMCFSHPIVTKYFLLLFDCSKANPYTGEAYDVERLQTNLDVDCSSSEHLTQQLTAVAGLVVYSLGIPCVTGCLLWKFRKKLQLKKYKQTFGFLYNGFESEVFYFESVMMIRKVIFSFCVVVPGLNDDGRVNILLSCALVFLGINKAYEPWDDRAYNILDRIERASLRSLILLLICRLLQNVTDKNYRFADQDTRDRRDFFLHLIIILQHSHAIYLMAKGVLRERARQRLLKMDKLSDALKDKIRGKPVDMDRTGALLAKEVTESERDFVVDIFKDAVDALLDRIAIISMIDLGAMICCAFSIANLEKLEKAESEGERHKLSAGSREVSEEECEEMSKRDPDTDLPKKILLGPVLAEELQMGFMHLLNQLTHLELSVLDRFRLSGLKEEPLRVLNEKWEKPEVPIEETPVEAFEPTLVAAAMQEDPPPAQPVVDPPIEQDLVLEDVDTIDRPKAEKEDELAPLPPPPAEGVAKKKKKKKRNFSGGDDMVIKTNTEAKRIGGLALPPMPDALGGVLNAAGGAFGNATKAVGNVAGDAFSKIGNAAGGLLRPVTPSSNVIKVAPASSSGAEDGI